MFSESAYGQLLEEIFQRFPSVQKTDFASAYKPGLAAMEAFCAALGHPERTFRSIHVAGTNGKGSVSSLLASVLSSCGLRTGLYTSPHLSDFRERARIINPISALSGLDGLPSASLRDPIRANAPGSPSSPEISNRKGLINFTPESAFDLIPKEYVFAFLTAWKPYFVEHGLSFFEITTGLAFKWFADEKVDIAVIETGLGGRLDSTNVITPVLSLVTTIGLDHCALLGDTLAAIAGEKAGIFKPGVPALVGESNPETDPVFDARARDLCPLTYADRVEPDLWERREEILPAMDLQAEVQRKNLRTVLAARDILRTSAGIQTDSDSVLDGLVHAARRTGFRGRWERLSERPPVIADIGHNPQALAYNFDQLRRYRAEGRCRSLVIVYGVMADKDLPGILPLMPEDATYLFAAPATVRALPAAEILRRFTAFAGDRPVRASATGTVAEAVREALALASALPDPLVFIGGSAFVVAEALPLFG